MYNNADVNISEFVSAIKRLNKTNDSKVQALNIRANVIINQHRFKATEHNCQELSSSLRVLISELKEYRPVIENDAKSLNALKELAYELNWRCMMLEGTMSIIPIDADENRLVLEGDRVLEHVLTIYELSNGNVRSFNSNIELDVLKLRFIRNRILRLWNDSKIRNWGVCAWTYETITEGLKSGFFNIMKGFQEALNNSGYSNIDAEIEKGITVVRDNVPAYVPGSNPIVDFFLDCKCTLYNYNCFKWHSPQTYDEIRDKFNVDDQVIEEAFNIAMSEFERRKRESNLNSGGSNELVPLEVVSNEEE